MTNNLDKSIIDRLKKIKAKHPEDEELQDFLQDVLDSNDDQDETDESTYVRQIEVSSETMDAAQMLIDAGVTNPDIIHEQTGIPMEALVAMGIEVPVRNYVIPVTRMSLGFVSVKGVSSEDALTMLEHNGDEEAIAKAISDDDVVLGMADDYEIIEAFTALAEKGAMGNVTDTGLVSPMVEVNTMS